jgi:uncharacterized protein (TIGR02646 family)
LPDVGAFHLRSRAFEKLGLNAPKRRAGFSEFAPEVLRKQNGKPGFPAIWGEAKKALENMSHHKCAYCEGGINAKSAEQVEHFKPKSLFPSLAYDWRNYFLGCGGCNIAKGNKWPPKGAYSRPDQRGVAAHFEFTANGKVRAKKAVAAARSTIIDFDLNREALIYFRRNLVEEMLEDLTDLLEVCRSDRPRGLRLARRKLGRIKEPKHQYSAALTQCFLREWRRSCPGVRL